MYFTGLFPTCVVTACIPSPELKGIVAPCSYMPDVMLPNSTATVNTKDIYG